MGFDIGALGMQAAGDVIGTGMGLLLEKHNDKRQLKQQQKLTNMQLGANKDMSAFNYAQQLKMWHDTNYSAQMEEMRKAGLNPALVYGDSGGGATTTGSGSGGGGISAGEAPKGGHEIMDIANQQKAAQLMQLELLKAQKENIQADTANKQAENPNIPLQGANTQADTQLKSIQSKLLQVATEVATSTKEDAIQKIQSEAQQAATQLNILTNSEQIQFETIKDQEQQIIQNAIGAMLHNKQIQAETKLTEEQAKAIPIEIAQKWKQLTIEQFTREVQANYPNIFSVLGKEVNDLISTITSKAGAGTNDQHRSEKIK